MMRAESHGELGLASSMVGVAGGPWTELAVLTALRHEALAVAVLSSTQHLTLSNCKSLPGVRIVQRPLRSCQEND